MFAAVENVLKISCYIVLVLPNIIVIKFGGFIGATFEKTQVEVNIALMAKLHSKNQISGNLLKSTANLLKSVH